MRHDGDDETVSKQCGKTLPAVSYNVIEKVAIASSMNSHLTPHGSNKELPSSQTSSTTAAIGNIAHAVTMLLESNKYVRCLLGDFSKALDFVDHLA